MKQFIIGTWQLLEIQHDPPIFNIKKWGRGRIFRSLFPEFVVNSLQFLVSKAYGNLPYTRDQRKQSSCLHFF